LSAKSQTENESFLDVLVALGFTIGTAGIILQSLQGNQALIRIVGSGTNFTLSAVQEQALTKAFVNAGISQTLSIEAVESIQQVPLQTPPRNQEIATKDSSAFTNALVAGGLSVGIARMVVNALNEDENVVSLIAKGKRPVIFMTKRDNKVDDKICLPLEGTVYAIDSPRRVRIPSETHPNCRCWYMDAITGDLADKIIEFCFC